MSKRNIVKQIFTVEIAVDADNISTMYPNYRFCFSKPEELIALLANDLKFCGETDLSKDGMRKRGYSIKIKRILSKA
jgi:hypothetical protein